MPQETAIVRERDGSPRKELTLAMVAEKSGYDLAQLAMIRHNMAATMRVTPDKVPLYDLAVFTHQAKTLQLDPLLKQCYWIVRGGRGQLQVSIDGFSAIADRTGAFGGSEPPEYRGWKKIQHPIFEWTYDKSQGKRVKTEVGTAEISVPQTARARVWKIVQGRSASFTGEADWDEFYPGPDQGDMWHKMPKRMLFKCALAQALRLAFPSQLASVAFEADENRLGVGEVTELPRVSPRPIAEVLEQIPEPQGGPTAEDYDGIYGAEYNDEDDRDQATADEEHQQQPATEDESQEIPGEGVDWLLEANRQLLQAAREWRIAGLGKLQADRTWPRDKIEAANRELTARIQSRNGDKAVAQQQERIL